VNSFNLIFLPFEFSCRESNAWVSFAKLWISKDYVVALEVCCLEGLSSDSLLGALAVDAAQVKEIRVIKWQSIVVDEGCH
jgi:hypothetical protein